VNDSATRNGAELLVDALLGWGVDTIFGMPGDGINGIMEAIRERKESCASSRCATRNPRH
jgi:thiamine pyrophosphate-dependent acetolactate synthase large subunit-like protein